MAGVKEPEWMYKIRQLGRPGGGALDPTHYEEDRDAAGPGMMRELVSRGIVPPANEGAVLDNPVDRMFAQARAAANNFAGEAEAFNEGAFGDYASVEGERNKAAGDLGRRLGAARRYEIDRAAKMRREQLPAREWLRGLFGR